MAAGVVVGRFLVGLLLGQNSRTAQIAVAVVVVSSSGSSRVYVYMYLCVGV